MKLQRIKIEGFKSIRELDLELRPLNVLIGANGAGKSNFISAFQILHEMRMGRFQLFVAKNGGAETFLHFGSKKTQQLSLSLEFLVHQDDHIYTYETSWIPNSKDALIFQNEVFFGQLPTDNELYPVRIVGKGQPESLMFQTASEEGLQPHIALVLEALFECKVYHFHDTSPEAGVKKTNDVDDNKFLRPDASNLAAFLYRLKEMQPEHYRRIVKTIRLAAPFFDDFDLEPSRLNADKIRLEWREVGSDTYFNASALSDGTLRFMCLCTLLLQPDLPSVILIDEPELGLHPYAITLLAEMLTSAAQQTQVIVSTQSVPLINQFTPEDIIVVDRMDGQSVFNRLNSEDLSEWLEEYSLGELWEKNVIGGRPRSVERNT